MSISETAAAAKSASIGLAAVETDAKNNALTAIAAAIEQHSGEIALVLSGLVMPEIGEMALCHVLRRRDPSVRAVVLASYPEEGSREELESAGMVGWLQKPVSLEQLAQVVARGLKERSETE